MAPSFADVLKTADEAENELLQCFSQEQRTFNEFEHFLSKFRSSSQNAILFDFNAARAAEIELRLWDAHVKVNNRFRKQLLHFREEHGKKKPVERRKLERHYLDFIKSSQRFYRGFIQHLSSHFGGIAELERVAHKFNHENLSGGPPIKPSDDLRKLILQSCHDTLIRLGDLSRYRESELVSKDRNWGPAIGYYDLASVIYPASGASQNQLAIIALADGNHLRATYHFYRALSAHEPHPTAKRNLEIELRKIKSAWAKRELIRPEDAGIPGKALTPWFLYLHAKCYQGTDFPEHDDLESEVLSQLAIEIRERSLEGTLQKFCLINIAAEECAKARSVEESSVSDACVFFQRINVKTFFTLLQILLVELERTASFEDSNSKDVLPVPDKISAVARRILPALRHYSSWLLTNSQSLVDQKVEKDSSLSIQVKEFWKIYAGTLSLLASSFDVVSLPEVDYLLEEDEETRGFAPLDQDATCRRYIGGGDQPKPRMHDLGVERSHPNMEMLYRIREFVIDGLDLVVRGKIPVALVDNEDKKTFIYQEEDFPPQFYSSPHGRQHALSTTSIEREDIPQPAQPYPATEAQSLFDGSQSASASMSANMHQIVEGVERLVDSDTYENPPNNEFPYMNQAREMPTPTHVSSNDNAYPFREENTSPPVGAPMAPPPGLGPSAITAADALRMRSAQSYTPRPSIPSLPSIWNPVADTASPRTPPGLGQQAPMHATGSGPVSIERSPSHDQLAHELLLRQHLMAQTQYSNSMDVGSMPTPWASSNAPPIPSSWDHNRAAFGAYELPTQSSLGHPSWANDAFIAGSYSGATPYSSGLPGRKQPTQLGTIGQTPPCGQGG
ncbi:DNA/RNA-binding domain E.t1.c1-type [Penicillium sp. DV-2018c]|nr:DNA/RNA-binding domain E.t1.c1-type [Penicillium sp. DV-2018c]